MKKELTSKSARKICNTLTIVSVLIFILIALFGVPSWHLVMKFLLVLLGVCFSIWIFQYIIYELILKGDELEANEQSELLWKGLRNSLSSNELTKVTYIIPQINNYDDDGIKILLDLWKSCDFNFYVKLNENNSITLLVKNNEDKLIHKTSITNPFFFISNFYVSNE